MPRASTSIPTSQVTHPPSTRRRRRKEPPQQGNVLDLLEARDQSDQVILRVGRDRHASAAFVTVLEPHVSTRGEWVTWF